MAVFKKRLSPVLQHNLSNLLAFRLHLVYLSIIKTGSIFVAVDTIVCNIELNT